MALQVSPIITASKKRYSDGYSYYQLSERFFGGLVDPLLSLDHFRLSEPTFPPHPHAGFSAVTYLLPTSAGSFRNRDSKGDDSTVGPGGLHWTLAGKGLIHDETPMPAGAVCEGLQVFVNLSAKGKGLEPRSFHVDPAQVPEWKPNAGVRVRVLVGRHSGVESPIRLPEPFHFLHAELRERASMKARVLLDSGALVYILGGKARLSTREETFLLEANQAIAFQSDDKDEELMVEALAGGGAGAPATDLSFVFLSGNSLKEPIVSHGPFVMNTREQISDAIEAYQRGEMGRLDPV